MNAILDGLNFIYHDTQDESYAMIKIFCLGNLMYWIHRNLKFVLNIFNWCKFYKTMYSFVPHKFLKIEFVMYLTSRGDICQKLIFNFNELELIIVFIEYMNDYIQSQKGSVTKLSCKWYDINQCQTLCLITQYNFILAILNVKLWYWNELFLEIIVTDTFAQSWR